MEYRGSIEFHGFEKKRKENRCCAYAYIHCDSSTLSFRLYCVAVVESGEVEICCSTICTCIDCFFFILLLRELKFYFYVENLLYSRRGDSVIATRTTFLFSNSGYYTYTLTFFSLSLLYINDFLAFPSFLLFSCVFFSLSQTLLSFPTAFTFLSSPPSTSVSELFNYFPPMSSFYRKSYFSVSRLYLPVLQFLLSMDAKSCQSTVYFYVCLFIPGLFVFSFLLALSAYFFQPVYSLLCFSYFLLSSMLEIFLYLLLFSFFFFAF